MVKCTYPINTKLNECGQVTGKTTTVPAENNICGQVCGKPRIVVPIIFLPGMMASNLRNKNKEKESVWNIESEWSLFKQWACRSAKTRQKKLNPTITEVDPERDCPSESATIENKKQARQRGWGEVSNFSYGEFLVWLDNELNIDCILENGCVSPWQRFVGECQLGEEWGAERPFKPFTEAQACDIWNTFRCPVYAMGYNWLASVAESSLEVKERITNLIEELNKEPDSFCKQVILVTHSMGGVLGRAIAHPAFGNLQDKILGIIHGVQPAIGAPTAYHRCRSGYPGISSIVLGYNAAQTVAIFAQAPGTMELLPSRHYPANWLEVRSKAKSSPIFSLPKADPYAEIYLEKEKWWRLVNPALLDPAKIIKKEGEEPWDSYEKNLKKTEKFHDIFDAYYHPQTYVHYGADTRKYPSYSKLIWHYSSVITHEGQKRTLSGGNEGYYPTPFNPERLDTATIELAQWQRGNDPVLIKVKMQDEEYIKNEYIFLQIAKPFYKDQEYAGDETVPATSGEAPNLQGGNAIQQSFRLKGFEHQDSYKDKRVRLTTLYSIGKLLEQAHRK